MIPGLGTALNTGTVLVGATIGLTLGRVIPPSLQQTIRIAIGLFVAVIGMQMALKTHNPLVLLVSVLLVQGSLTLVAFLVHAGLTDLETAELTAAGGIAVLGIALGLLELKTIKVANFLPALVVAPLLAGILHSFGM